jgi:hypothetical protein
MVIGEAISQARTADQVGRSRPLAAGNHLRFGVLAQDHLATDWVLCRIQPELLAKRKLCKRLKFNG